MKRQEIGDEEPEYECDQPDSRTELHRRQIGLERDAEIGDAIEAAFEDLHIAARGECRQNLIFVVVPEAHHNGPSERQKKKDDKTRRKGSALQPCRSMARKQSRRWNQLRRWRLQG